MIGELSPALSSRLRRLREGARTPSPTFETQGSLRPPKAARLTRGRLAVISLVVIVAVSLTVICQSNLVQARFAERGASQLQHLISSLTPQTDKKPLQLGLPQANQESQRSLSPLSPLAYSSTLTGPILPPSMPFGATHVTGDPGNTGLIGRAGGNTWYFFNVNLPAACGNTTYWGPQNNLVRLSFINSSFLNTPGEVLTFQPAQSNLPAGIAVWTGFTFNPTGGQTVFTKFTMTANLHSGAAPGGTVGAAIPLTDPTTVGLAPNIGALVPVTPGINYQINMRFDASFTNGSGYSPALDFYDANSTAGGTCFESFTAGFYYYNFLPTISDIANQTTLMGAPSGPHPFTVGDCEISPGSLSVSGTSSNTTLVPNANISFGGGGSSRNVLVTPAAGESGTTTITVSVSDGLNTTSDTFDLLVDAPPAWVTTGGTVDEPTGNEANPIQRSLNLSLDDPDSSQVLTFSLAGGTGYCGASPTHPFTGLAFSPPTTPTVAGNEATSLLFNVGANDAAASPYCVRIIADDGFTNSSQDLTIAVTQQNSDPGWFTTAGTVDEPIGNDADPIGRTISLSLNDPDDSQTLSFTLAGGTGDCGAPGTHPFTGLSFDPASTPTVSGNESTLLHLNVGANAAANSPYCVRVTASDGTSASDRDLSVTVTPQNSNPTISDVGNQLTQRNVATAAIPFTVGDIDADDPPGALIMSGTSSDTVLVPNANIVFGGSGASRDVTITPANNQTGTTTITLTVTDTHGGTASDTFDLRVNAVPVFSTNTGLILDQGATATITNAMLTVTDADNTAAQLKYTIASVPNGGPPHQGTLKRNNVALSSGSFFTQEDVNNNLLTYTHDDSNNITDDFQFNITDGDGATLPNDGVHFSFSFSISITLINHAPEAVDGNGTTGIGAPFNGIFAATDRDVPAQTLTRRIVTNGTRGVAVLNDATTGAFTYTPNPGESGPDTIVFQVNDGSLDSVNPGTFTIDIQNQPPAAQNGSGNTTEGVVLNGMLGATDPDQPPQTLTFVIATNGAKGSALITNANTGAFTYTPNPNAFGSDSFTFTVSDGLVTSAPGTFTITIKPNLDAGDIFVTNTATTQNGQVGSVVQIDPNNGMQFLVSTGGNLTNPSAIIIEHDGNLVVLNRNNSVFSLVRVDPSTGAQSAIPAGPAFANPVGLGIGPGVDLFVGDPFAGSVFEVNPVTGALVHTFSGGLLGGPVGIAFDHDGNLLVSDASGLFGGSSKIVRIDPATDAQTLVSTGGGLLLPADIALDSNGDIIVSEAPNLFGPGTGSLLRVNATSGVQTLITGTGLGKPATVAVKASNNNSFTPDNSSNTVLMTTPAGVTTTVASGENLTQPYGIAMIPPLFTISGRVTYANGTTPGKNVTMTLTGPAGFTPQITTTDLNGDYSFTNLPGGNNYTVTPSKTGDNATGLQSFDAALAARYVAGLDIPTANQRIAADADGDGILTSLDAAFIARRAAGLPGFGIVGTWKFSPTNRTYLLLTDDALNQIFTAILVGDTSGDWQPL